MSANQTPNNPLNLNQQLDRYFLACSALVGVATLAGTSDANAAIVYSGIRNISFPETNNAGGIYIDLETGGTFTPTDSGQGTIEGLGTALPGWDLNPYFITSGGTIKPFIFSQSGGSIATNGFPAFSVNAASMFSAGQTIDGSLTYKGGTTRLVSNVTPGPWVDADAYIGLRFNSSTATGLFAWLHVTTGPSVTGESAGVPALIVDWAYDDSGAPIVAGAVPEPSSMALGCLAAGAAGMTLWRKRKKAV